MNDDKAPSGGTPVLANVLMLSTLCLTLLVILFGIVFLVPKYAEVFIQLNIHLPAITRLTLSVCAACYKFWFAVLPLAGLLGVLPWLVARRQAWVIYLAATLLALILAFAGLLNILLPMLDFHLMLSTRQSRQRSTDEAPGNPPRPTAPPGRGSGSPPPPRR